MALKTATYLNSDIDKLYKETLLEVAEDVTMYTARYISRTLYGRKPSPYYDRMDEDGGFLSTFVGAEEYKRLFDNAVYVRGTRYFIRVLLRNYNNLRYRSPAFGQFGARTGWKGEELYSSNYFGEAGEKANKFDTYIDKGYHITLRNGVKKTIQGIGYKAYAEEYIKTKGYSGIQNKLGSGVVPSGKALLSIPLPEINIIVE